MEILRIERNNKRQHAEVYYENKRYYVSDNGNETLIFGYNSDGTVNYLEVGGAKNTTLDEVLASFSSYLLPF